MKHLKVKFSIREDQLAALHRLASQVAIETRTYQNDVSGVLRSIIDLVLGEKDATKKTQEEGVPEGRIGQNRDELRALRRKNPRRGSGRKSNVSAMDAGKRRRNA